MSEHHESRIADAKLRVTTAKQRLGVAAVATFVGLLGLAWASHPGKATTSGTQDTSSTTTSTSQSDDFGGLDAFGGIASGSGSTPQVQSSVS